MNKPDDIFDRDWEWAQLRRFVADPRPGATLGIVSGRRRQGKSTLLHALAETGGGFYCELIDGALADILADLGAKLAAFLGAPVPLQIGSSAQAIAALLDLRRDGPVPIVIDEFPAWVSADPSAASLVRNALGPGGRGRTRGRARLVLCGSALRLMGGLLAGQSPLRGRAGLELVVDAFDFRTARQFWGIRDRELAARVFAVVGGTPAYRREFVADDVPDGPGDFDAWVARTALNPATPLFREARYLLAEDPAVGELSLYHSVLAAIASGETTSAKIGGRLGRPATALAHPLSVLADSGFVERQQDAFHAKKVHYAITEPIVAFHHAILRPAWSELQRPGRADAVWRRMTPRFESAVLGPAFESMCRTWVARFSDPALWDEPVATVRRGLVPDAARRTTHEVDVVAIGESGRILALGEAKWGARPDSHDHERLRHIAGLLAARGHAVEDARLLWFGARGSRGARRRDGVLTFGLDTLYDG